MAKKKYTSKEGIHKPREADVLLGQGKSVAEAWKQSGRHRPDLLPLAILSRPRALAAVAPDLAMCAARPPSWCAWPNARKG